MTWADTTQGWHYIIDDTPNFQVLLRFASLFPVDLETLHWQALHQIDPRPQVAHLFLATPTPDALVIREVIVVPPIGPLSFR